MGTTWCRVCCTTHGMTGICPGELTTYNQERHGWRVNVDTPRGIEAYGVLLAMTDCGKWRARVLTFPNILWAVPGGQGTIKFAADTPVDAEHQAIEYLREHCRNHGLNIRNETAMPAPGPLEAENGAFVQPTAATRMIRFLPIRFGVVTPSEVGGTANLSETGLFVITNHPVLTNTRLRLLLDVDQQPLTLTGDVRWMNESPRAGRPPGMGLRLHAPPPAYADYVRTLS